MKDLGNWGLKLKIKEAIGLRWLEFISIPFGIFNDYY